MVRAIDENRKTVTRRTVKPQIINEELYLNRDLIAEYDNGQLVKCKQGKPGDILWVREPWRIIGWDLDCDEMLVQYKNGRSTWCDAYNPEGNYEWLSNHVEDLAAKGFLEANNKTERYEIKKELPWRPSIFMPKEACRIFLKVTDTKVERLNRITPMEAINEGVEKIDEFAWKNYLKTLPVDTLNFPHHSFQSLWESINGEDSWHANPWVWVIHFKKTDKPQNWPV